MIEGFSSPSADIGGICRDENGRACRCSSARSSPTSPSPRASELRCWHARTNSRANHLAELLFDEGSMHPRRACGRLRTRINTHLTILANGQFCVRTYTPSRQWS